FSTISPVTYIPGLCAFAIAGVLAVVPSSLPDLRHFGLTVAPFVFGIGALLVARAWFHRWTTEVAVTSRLVIYKRGFISRATFEIPLDKVEGVDVVQTVLGRIFDYGDIIIRGVGEGRQRLHAIDAPIELRNHVTAA